MKNRKKCAKKWKNEWHKNAIGNLIKHLRMIQWQTINIVDISAQLSVLNLHLSYPFFFFISILRPYHQLIFLFFCSLLNSQFLFLFFFFDGSGSYTYNIYVKMSLILFVNNSMPMNLIPFFYSVYCIVLLTSMSISLIFAYVENSNFYN